MIVPARGGRTRRWTIALFVAVLLALVAPAVSAATPAAGTHPVTGAIGAAPQPLDAAAGPAGAGQVALAGVPAAITGSAPTSATGDGYDNTLAFTLSAISPRSVSSGTGDLTITGTVTNTSAQPVSDLQFRFQLGTALTSVAAVRKAVSSPTDPDATVTSPFQPFSDDLAPKQSTKFTAEVPTFADGSDSLALTKPGVFPLMLNVNGTIGSGGTALLARVGALHVLLTVLSVPGQATESPPPGPTSLQVKNPVPLTMLWPIQDRVHLGVDGVFLDDDLATTIGPQGRLSTVLTNLEELDRTTAGATATVVLDPELLDELSRMAAGYRVLADPGTPQPALTPVTTTAATGPTPTTSTTTTPTTPTTSTTTTSTTKTAATRTAAGAAGSVPPAPSAGATASAGTTGTTGTRSATSTVDTTGTTGADNPAYQVNTVPGTGQAAAAAFLLRLRTDVARHQAIVLPYSDPDTVGLAHSGQAATLANLRTVGQAIVARVLPGLPILSAVTATPATNGLITTLAYPARGRGDTATLTDLAAAGDTATLLSGGVVAGDKNAGLATVTLDGGRQLPAVVADSPLLSDVNALTAKTGASATLPYNTLTALLTVAAEGSNANAPILVLADRFWNAGGGAHELATLAGALGAADVVQGGALPALAAQAGQTTAHTLNDFAVRPVLAPDQLRRAQSEAAWVNRLSLQLSKAAGTTAPEPSAVLDPLREALTRVYAIPIAPTGTGPPNDAGAAIVATVERTEVTLRSGVKLLTSDVPFSLSASSVLPIGVQNDLPYDVVVRLRVVGGDQVGLTVTQPADATVTPGQARQVRVDAHVIRSGKFGGVQVELLATDNTQWGAPAQITIRSNAYGVVILIVIWVAGAVLVLMVAFQLAQRVRKSRQGDDPAGSAGDGTEPPDPNSILGAAAEAAARPRRRPRRSAGRTGPASDRTRPAGRPDNPDLIGRAGQLDAEHGPHTGSSRRAATVPEQLGRVGERHDSSNPSGQSRES